MPSELRLPGIKAIHQVVVSATPNDAVFNNALLLRTWFQSWGYATGIFAEHVSPLLPSGDIRSYRYLPIDAANTLIIYHYSTGSPVTQYLTKARSPVAMIYHNVTPAEYFVGVSQQLYDSTSQGRREVADLAGIPLAIALSEYSRSELIALGFGKTFAIPPAFEPKQYDVRPDDSVLQKMTDGGCHLLFVGRIVPNKCCEDLLHAFYYFKQIEPQSHLWLVGSSDLCERYTNWLEGLVEYLCVPDVHFVGKVSNEELVAYYRGAHAYLCLSEHEGFCVPLLESMYFEVPIVAYAAAAVPGTLGGAGVLVTRKSYPVIAELLQLVVRDTGLRSALIAGQSRRLNSFRPDLVKATLASSLESAFAGG